MMIIRHFGRVGLIVRIMTRKMNICITFRRSNWRRWAFFVRREVRRVAGPRLIDMKFIFRSPTLSFEKKSLRDVVLEVVNGLDSLWIPLIGPPWRRVRSL